MMMMIVALDGTPPIGFTLAGILHFLLAASGAKKRRR